MNKGTINFAERRAVLMREAAEELASLPPSKRTLDEFERLTAQKATERDWHRAAFERQHLRNHAEIRAIYESSRFPDRDPAHARLKLPKKATDPELLARLVESEAKLVEERNARREAECLAARVKIDNAVDVVREFIRQMGLTTKSTSVP